MTTSTTRRRSLRRQFVLALATVAAINPALASPTGAFGSVPDRDTAAPKGTGAATSNLEPGPDGSLSYSYAIDLPPGRNGMKPDLALHYSSNGELRGGVAAGWSLDIPHIDRDPAFTGSDYVYTAEIGGMSGRLVPSSDPVAPGVRSFRLEHDQEFARFEASGADGGVINWTVRFPDGRSLSFPGGGASYGDGNTRWNVGSEQDADGNDVQYSYQAPQLGTYIDWLPAEIIYSANASANLPAATKVDFTYAPVETCLGSSIPIGASVSHRFPSAWGNYAMHGSKRLTDIVVSVRDPVNGTWRQARDVKLSYDPNALACGQAQAPLRYLTQIDQTVTSAAGVVSAAPPVKLSYGPTVPTWSASKSLGKPGWLSSGDQDGENTRIADFDGDGLPDLLSVGRFSNGCTLYVQRGLPGGGFAIASAIHLPSVDWGPLGVGNGSCNLNRQHTLIPDVLVNPVSGTSASTPTNVAYELVDWNGDGRLDVVTGVWAFSFTTLGGDFAPTGMIFAAPTGTAIPGDCIGGGGTLGGLVGYTGVSQDVPVFECSCPSGQGWDDDDQRCEATCWSADAVSCQAPGLPQNNFIPPVPEPGATDGTYRWRVWLNNGNSFVQGPMFDLAAPLPASGAATTTRVDSLTVNPPLIADFDGDGLPDVLTTPRIEGVIQNKQTIGMGSATTLSVYPGRGDQGAGTVIGIPVPSYRGAADNPNEFGPYGTTMSGTVPLVMHDFVDHQLALHDEDGDGYPDLLVQPMDAAGVYLGIAALWNRGKAGFALTQLGAPSTTHPLSFTNAVTSEQSDLPNGWESSDTFSAGQRATQRAVTDLDGDGLPDYYWSILDVSNALSTSSRGIQIGLGDGFSASANLASSAWDAMKHALIAYGGDWHRASDVVDLTGDGIPDLVSIAADGTVTIQTEPAGEAAPRLLASIDNGRGLQEAITYAPSTDPSTVTLAGTTLPSPHWVVKQVVTTPGGAQPAQTHRYTYTGALRGRASNLDAPTHFLGFHTMTSDEIDGGGAVARRTVTDYMQVGNGPLRPADQAVYANSAIGGALAGTPVSVATHAYTTVPTVPGGASFIYESTTGDYTCTTGQTLAQCTADTTNLVTRTEHWATQTSGGTPFYFRDRAVTLSPTAGYEIDDTYYPWNTATDFHIVHTGETRYDYVMAGDVPVDQIATAQTTWENVNAHWHPQVEAVWIDGTRATAAVTTRTYDNAGNVISVRRPNQATTTLATTITFDAWGMYPIATTNELGQRVQTQYDYATGALIERDGPNSRTYTPAGAPAAVTQLEPESWTVDGFGRVLSHSVADDPATPGGYASFVLETSAYNDAVVPNQRVTQTSLAYRATGKRTTTELFDGRGLVLSHAETGGTGTPTVTTSYAYDPAGNLASITQPDPRDDTKLVTYRYTRDGLGRVTSFIRPDNSSQTMAYGHLDTLVTEVSSSPGDGPARRIDYTKDLLGRLVTVMEYDNPSPGTATQSHYTYDSQGRTTSVTDGDGTVTTMIYDEAGRRTQVARGGRTWLYSYDADGNLTGRTDPVPTGATAAQYTSSSTYDALDRVTSHTAATRGMTSSQLTKLGIGTVTYKYDLYPATNGIGALGQVIYPFGNKVVYFDVHHHEYEDVWTLSLAGASTFNVRPFVVRSFTPSGLVTAEKWDDGTQFQTMYDFRDLPKQALWLDQTLATPAWKNIAVYTRSAAGQPRTRTSDYGQSRTWTYDALGKVVYDRVYVGSGTTSKSERTYGYDGLGELRAISGQNDGLVADATFDYDATHRLVHAQGPGTYSASLTYTAAGNITHATVPGRDARYAYGAVDPQAVDSLRDWTTGASLASLAYDRSGNVVQRTAGTANETLIWDGDDQLREVTGTNGDTRYWYDESGSRIAAFNSTEVKLWTGTQEIHYTPTGTQTLRWASWDTGEPVARVSNKTNLELEYADVLGSTMLSLDRNGATQGSFLYGAFGEVVASVGADTHPREFNGKEGDETALRYYGARFYDPLLMRWTSADPLYRANPDHATESPQRGNWYTFSLNNPVRYVDPDGRDGDDAYLIQQGDHENLFIDEGASTTLTNTFSTTSALDPGVTLVSVTVPVGVEITSTGDIQLNENTANVDTDYPGFINTSNMSGDSHVQSPSLQAAKAGEAGSIVTNAKVIGMVSTVTASLAIPFGVSYSSTPTPTGWSKTVQHYTHVYVTKPGTARKIAAGNTLVLRGAQTLQTVAAYQDAVSAQRERARRARERLELQKMQVERCKREGKKNCD